MSGRLLWSLLHKLRNVFAQGYGLLGLYSLVYGPPMQLKLPTSLISSLSL
jgi:hypothetical protein